jgi:anaerobic dimethyl sulfoxide reductase subunit A
VTLLPVSCNRDCGAGCPLLARVEDGRLTRVSDNPERPKGMSGCIRGYRMPQVVHHPQRLTRPLMRTGARGSGGFREVGWEEALSFVATRLAEIRDRHGAQAVLRLGGSGSCRGALHNTGLLSQRFLALFGGFTGSTDSYSSAGESFTLPHLFGTKDIGIDPDTLQDSRLVLLWGANVVDTRFGCLLEQRLRELRRRGVSIVVVDPRRSRTAERLADRWVALRPGTDAALMAAVLHELCDRDLVARDRVRRLSVGFDVLERRIRGTDGGQPMTPQWAEVICGTPAGEIRELARLYGTTRPAALISGLSIQRTLGGEEAVRMAVALQVATGNLGVPGGAPGTSIWGRLPSPRCGRIPVPSPPHPARIPVYRWADAVLEGRRGGYPTDVRALYTVGGNYLCTGSDVAKNVRAFTTAELTVCHELFLTPTARYCDVVLPATTFLEREDIVFTAHNYLHYSHQAVAPVGEARNDYDILADLADRLGFGSAFTEDRNPRQWLDHFLEGSEVPDPEEFRRCGIHAGSEQRRIGLQGFARDPDRNPLSTPSGRVELASQAWVAQGFAELPSYRGAAAPNDYPLQLVTPHARYRVNSQFGTDPAHGGQEPQRLWLHPQDAARRSINDRDLVEVRSAEGRMRVRVKLTDGILPGVTCLLAGAWPSMAGDGTDEGGCANVLTSTEPTLPSQGSRTHTVFVQVSPWKPRGAGL